MANKNKARLLIKKNKTKIIALIIGALVIVIILSFYTGLISSNAILNIFKKPNSASSGNYQQVVLTKANFAQFLQSQQFVKDIPSSTTIFLKLYSMNNGQQQWEETYVIKKSSVKSGTTDSADVIISVDSKYLSQLGADICKTIKTARNNGEMKIETKLTTAQLLWKFKSMLKYRDCLGI